MVKRGETFISQEKRGFHWSGEERLSLGRRKETFIGQERRDFQRSREERLSLVRRGETVIGQQDSEQSEAQSMLPVVELVLKETRGCSLLHWNWPRPPLLHPHLQHSQNGHLFHLSLALSSLYVAGQGLLMSDDDKGGEDAAKVY